MKFPIAQYFPSTLDLDPSSRQKLENSLLELDKGNLSRIVLLCLGYDCEFCSQCPIHNTKDNNGKRLTTLIEGALCPLELRQIEILKEGYMRVLSDLNSEDTTLNFIDRKQIEKLIEIDILDQRASMGLRLSNMFDLNVIGVDDSGTPMTQKVESVYLRIKELLYKQRQRLLVDNRLNRKERVSKEVGIDTDEVEAKYRTLLDKT